MRLEHPGPASRALVVTVSQLMAGFSVNTPVGPQSSLALELHAAVCALEFLGGMRRLVLF